MARDDDQQPEGIRLDDGTWVDVGPDGKWRPSPAERARAAVVLTIFFAVLLTLALVLSAGDDDDEVDVARETATTTDTTEATTTTTTEPDPSSIGGEPASATCRSDDRGGAPLRDRDESVVQVLNGTSRTGHAGDLTEYLDELGYDTVVPANTSRRAVTSIAYLTGFCAEAERAASDLGLLEATVEPVPPELLPETGRTRLVVSAGADSL